MIAVAKGKTMYLNNHRSILLLEDDIIDVMTVQRALDELNIRNRLIIQSNGEEGLKFLNQSPELPGIIFLDLNMPKMNGLEFLKKIKQDKRFQRIPVIVLTTSKEQQDKQKCFQLSVAGYMVKPVSYENFLRMLETIQSYWAFSEYLE